MRRISSVCLTALVAGSLHAALAAPPADPNQKAKFSVSQQTEVPGLQLQPGAYSIRVVDHLADRLIVRIDDANTGKHSTFIGLPNSGLPKSSAGMITYASGPDGGSAARGFSFPGGPTVEFVYPKAEAVSLAKLNGTKVTAIDPASEGRVPKADNELSKDDMEVVTLWTLSSTKVSPEDAAPSIKAERYQQPAPAASSQVAVNHKPAVKPVIAKLPHTAGYMPLVVLLGLLSLLSAAVLRIGRKSVLAK